ncbi:hypothetical protein AN641_07035 [Candidatus Epulonipiscioides gigas]|nr:hypothetical protein AN641_07035 [Epulopiscium sp. SCG-C07WGA-EpuloA2]
MIYTGLILTGIGTILTLISIFKIIAENRKKVPSPVPPFSTQEALKEVIILPQKSSKNIFRPKQNFDLVQEVQHNLRSYEDLNEEDKKVVTLAKSGYSITQIAKQLNRGKGEIELILNLTKNRKDTLNE